MEKVTKKRKLAPRKTVMSSGLKPLTLTGLSDRTKKDLGILGAEGDELVIEDPTVLGGKGFNLKPPKRASRAKKRKSTMPPEKPLRKSPRIATIDKLDIASDEGSSNGAETGDAQGTDPPVVETANAGASNPSIVKPTGAGGPAPPIIETGTAGGSEAPNAEVSGDQESSQSALKAPKENGPFPIT